MKNILIGKILKAFNEAYEEGACDNITGQEQQEIINQLSEFYDKLAVKKDDTLTTEQASRYLNVTRQTINNYVKAGKLHPIKQLGGVLQFNRVELNKLKYKK